MRSVDIRLAPVERHYPGTTGLSFHLSEHADEHRPRRPVLLAVDQELGEFVDRSREPSMCRRRSDRSPTRSWFETA
jgi:hypothetical protein